MSSLFQNYRGPVIAAIAVLVVVMMSVVVVPETQQAVIIRTGEPVRKVNTFKTDAGFGETGAGIVLRIPLIERVERIDKRVLDLDMERQTVLSSDQQRLQVDAYARFRIIDPVTMVEQAGTTENVRSQLEPILISVLRQELGRRTFQAMLTAERGNAMTNIRGNLDQQARKYGAQIIDVRIKRTDLPAGVPIEAAYTRMRTDRNREAETIRANGNKDAQIIRAEADAEAANTYAGAFGRDPDFYDFYRAMRSYETTFNQGEAESSIILSPDNEYLSRFRQPGR